MSDQRYFRRTLVALLVMALTTPVLLWGIQQAMSGMVNAPIFWIPPENQQRQDYEWYYEHFGIRDAVVISWKGCHVDDPRLPQLADALLSDERAPNGRRYNQIFERVVSGYGILRELTAEPLVLERSEAIARLQGTLVGPDGRTTCAVAMITPAALSDKDAVLDAILQVLEKRLSLDPNDCHLAGSPVESVAIDGATARSINYYLLPSGILVLLLSRLCLGSWRFTAAVITVAAFGEALVLALVHFSGATMNAVLSVMAPLVFVLTVSAGVHLVNYFRDEVRLRGLAGASARALRAGWLPCTLAAVTTAIGMGSLMVSEIEPVRQFGAISATGVLITTALLFLVIPGLEQTAARRDDAEELVDRGLSLTGVWHHLAEFITRFAIPISILIVTLMGLGLWGLSYVKTSVTVLHLMAPDSRIIEDYGWLEENLAPMVPVEVIVRFDRDCPLDLVRRIELLRQIEQDITEVETLGGSLSAATFVPEIPRGLRASVRRSVLRSKLEGELEDFQQAQYLYERDGRQWWRISTRAPALEDVDYGRLMERLDDQIEPTLAAYREQGIEGIRAMYTGTTPLVHVAQQTLLSDLINSFLTAFVLVTIVMVLLLRSLLAGLVVMIPNLFPMLILFGSMGWIDAAVDIGSMMTASVALGIAIDGTLHYLTWYRREIESGRAPREAVQRAYEHCGTAMWQTTVICGLGLLVFALSDFVPTQRFAWMMLGLLLAALVGDLILLPALLTGPLRWVMREKKQD